MRNKIIKIIGYCCLLCIVVIGWIFVSNILLPALAQPRATKPLLVFHMPSKRIFHSVLRPTPEQPHPTKPITISHVVQQEVGSLAFTPDGKQLLGRIYLGQIKRWDVSSGKELTPIQSSRIKLVSDDGQFYVTYDFIKNQDINQRDANQRLHRTSDQSIVALLPNNTKDKHLIKIIGGTHPFAIYYSSEKTVDKFPTRSLGIKRRYYVWDIQTKQFISTTPHTTTLYDFEEYIPDVAYSDDGLKVLSLWPTYTRTNGNKTITVTKNFIHWSYPDYHQEPKGALLLNELNGNTITLPFPEKTASFWFGWNSPALSKNQKYYATVSTNDSVGWAQNGIDGTIWCYDLGLRSLKWKYYGDKQFPSLLLFSPDGTMLAFSGYDNNYRTNGAGFLNVVDVKTGKLLHRFTEQTLSEQIRDRTRIYALQKLWHYSIIRERFPRLSQAMQSPPAPGNSGPIKALSWSPNSKTLAASYKDGSVKVWRVKG